MKLTNKSRARPRARHVISAGKPIISAPSANQPPNTPQVATVQPVTTKATPSVPSTEVAAITSFLFGMESEDRTGCRRRCGRTTPRCSPTRSRIWCLWQLQCKTGDIHIPPPHYVQDSVAGWLPTRPKDSPTLPVQFSVDRPAYAQLRVPLPKFSNSKHPGRSYVFCRTSLQVRNIEITPSSP